MSTLTLGPPGRGPADLGLADRARRAGLRRMRAVATSLLLLAAVVYLLTLHRTGALGFVNAAAEAAMVGALADWFAVTALFRHPLGLPIPHTALVPTRKAALGQSLQDFVTEHFLTEEVVRTHVASAGIGRRVGAWLHEPAHAERVVVEGTRMLRAVLLRVSDDDVRTFAEQALLPRLAQEPMSPIAGELLAGVVADGAHHGLLDLALVEAHDWLSANPDTVARVVGSRAPWWSPRWLDEKVIDRVHLEVLAWLADVRDHPAHPARRALDDLLTQLADDLRQDEATQARAEALKVRVLSHPDVPRTVVATWDAVRRALLGAVEDRDAALWPRAIGAVRELGGRMSSEPAMQQRVDGWACDAVAFVARTYGREITAVISQTVDRWDAREASERIELHVGRDLQFIRINGTVVGGLAGLAIHAVAMLL